MPADDAIYEAVKNALLKDGWIITNDPLTLEYGEFYLFVDLGVEKVIAAARGPERVAVEIKSFRGRSHVHDLQHAVGQYILYKLFLQQLDPDRVLYLAISDTAYADHFDKAATRFVIDSLRIPLIVVRIDTEEVVQWNE